MLGTLNATEIEELLHREVIGRLGCLSDGRVYVVPITYAYDGECVYAHSGDGMKLRAMRANPEVCFEVEQVDDLARWRSVIAWGTYEELRGDEATRGMHVLIERLRPLMTSRIRLRERTGRFERR